jgi:hypothetical protein
MCRSLSVYEPTNSINQANRRPNHNPPTPPPRHQHQGGRQGPAAQGAQGGAPSTPALLGIAHPPFLYAIPHTRIHSRSINTPTSPPPPPHQVTVVHGDPASGAVLQKAGLDKADAAVLCGFEGTGVNHDTQVGGAGLVLSIHLCGAYVCCWGHPVFCSRLSMPPTSSSTSNSTRPKPTPPQVVATILQLQALSAAHQAEGKRATSLDVVSAVASNSTEEILWVSRVGCMYTYAPLYIRGRGLGGHQPGSYLRSLQGCRAGGL